MERGDERDEPEVGGAECGGDRAGQDHGDNHGDNDDAGSGGEMGAG